MARTDKGAGKSTQEISQKQASDRNRALDAALGQIEKQFGKGAVMKLGERTAMQVESISTGALSLDLALGFGGVPRGRVVEIYGPESSGKTTSPCTSSRKPSVRVAQRLSLMLSTPSTRIMQPSWGSTSTT